MARNPDNLDTTEELKEQFLTALNTAIEIGNKHYKGPDQNGTPIRNLLIPTVILGSDSLTLEEKRELLKTFARRDPDTDFGLHSIVTAYQVGALQGAFNAADEGLEANYDLHTSGPRQELQAELLRGSILSLILEGQTTLTADLGDGIFRENVPVVQGVIKAEGLSDRNKQLLIESFLEKRAEKGQTSVEIVPGRVLDIPKDLRAPREIASFYRDAKQIVDATPIDPINEATPYRALRASINRGEEYFSMRNADDDYEPLTIFEAIVRHASSGDIRQSEERELIQTHAKNLVKKGETSAQVTKDISINLPTTVAGRNTTRLVEIIKGCVETENRQHSQAERLHPTQIHQNTFLDLRTEAMEKDTHVSLRGVDGTYLEVQSLEDIFFLTDDHFMIDQEAERTNLALQLIRELATNRENHESLRAQIDWLTLLGGRDPEEAVDSGDPDDIFDEPEIIDEDSEEDELDTESDEIDDEQDEEPVGYIDFPVETEQMLRRKLDEFFAQHLANHPEAAATDPASTRRATRTHLLSVLGVSALLLLFNMSNGKATNALTDEDHLDLPDAPTTAKADPDTGNTGDTPTPKPKPEPKPIPGTAFLQIGEGLIQISGSNIKEGSRDVRPILGTNFIQVQIDDGEWKVARWDSQRKQYYYKGEYDPNDKDKGRVFLRNNHTTRLRAVEPADFVEEEPGLYTIGGIDIPKSSRDIHTLTEADEIMIQENGGKWRKAFWAPKRKRYLFADTKKPVFLRHGNEYRIKTGDGPLPKPKPESEPESKPEKKKSTGFVEIEPEIYEISGEEIPESGRDFYALTKARQIAIKVGDGEWQDARWKRYKKAYFYLNSGREVFIRNNQTTRIRILGNLPRKK